jgi:ABC-type branched-subunit amino acid transport system substrate-binding protein/predicted negative regulator of RcsB-dependent stress response
MKSIITLGITIGFFVLCVSCVAAPPVKREAKKLLPAAEMDFHKTEALARAGDAKKALPKLKNFVQANPDSEYTAEAYYQMGILHQGSQQYLEAIKDFSTLLNLPIAHRFEVDGTLRLARVQVKISQFAEADKTLGRSSRWTTATSDQLLELEKLRYEIMSAQKQHLPALESLIVLAEKSAQVAERDKYRVLAIDSIDSRFSLDDLRKIGDSAKFSFVRQQAKFRFGLLMAEQHQFARAREYFAETAALAPGTELADRANTLVSQIDARNRVDAHTIGVVLPLSGKQSAIGYKALRGIQLGLGIYGNPGGQASGFKLAVIDSEGNPDMARVAVERLVQEDHVIALIGGQLSKTASAEAAKAQEFGVPTIMLSQKAGVTQAGDFVFRNAVTSQMQVQHLVDVAMSKMGMKNFAILYPNDAYGVEFANLFWDEVRYRGGNIQGAQPYDPQETDFRGYIQRLVGTFFLEDRADEFHLLTKAWAEKNPRRSSKLASPPPEELLPPIIDFDAIFIPDSAKTVGQIAPMLAYNNVNNVRLLGTNLWNSPSLVSRGQRFVENSIFIDSVSTAGPTFRGSDFFVTFKNTFDEEPGLTEIQAYDSALILRQIIAGGEDTRGGLQARMVKLENFPGAIGRLSVNSEREFLRPLTSLTVREGKVVDTETRRR